MPTSLHLAAVAWAAIMAAYGDDSSRSALTIMPPVDEQVLQQQQRSCNFDNVKPTSDSADRLLSSEIGDVDKGVVERGKDVGDTLEARTQGRVSISSSPSMFFLSIFLHFSLGLIRNSLPVQATQEDKLISC